MSEDHLSADLLKWNGVEVEDGHRQANHCMNESLGNRNGTLRKVLWMSTSKHIQSWIEIVICWAQQMVSSIVLGATVNANPWGGGMAYAIMKHTALIEPRREVQAIAQ